MKKLILGLCVILISVTTSFAANADLFSYNEEELNSALVEVNKLEELLLAEDCISYESLLLNNSMHSFKLYDEPVVLGYETNPDSDGAPDWIVGVLIGVVGCVAVGCLILLL